MSDLCKYLEWDSRFFACNIARCLPTVLAPEDIPLILAWCKQEHIDCLYFLSESDDLQTVQLVEKNDFNFVDIRLTLEKTFKIPPENPEHLQIRTCQPDDVPILRKIASQGFTDTRFYYDDHFPVERCDELYATWIEKSCSGYADVVWTVDHQQQPAGFLSCHRDDDHGQIGLFGIDVAARGKGLGTRLIQHALHWFYQQGVQNVSVVTQGRNISAQRAYQQAGFRTSAVQLWYHRWFRY